MYAIFLRQLVRLRRRRPCSHSIFTMPLFATVGLREKAIRSLAIDDLVRVLRATLVDAGLARQTVAITGAQALYLSEAAPRVAQVLDRRVWIFLCAGLVSAWAYENVRSEDESFHYDQRKLRCRFFLKAWSRGLQNAILCLLICCRCGASQRRRFTADCRRVAHSECMI